MMQNPWEVVYLIVNISMVSILAHLHTRTGITTGQEREFS